MIVLIKSQHTAISYMYFLVYLKEVSEDERKAMKVNIPLLKAVVLTKTQGFATHLTNYLMG